MNDFIKSIIAGITGAGITFLIIKLLEGIV